MVEKGKSVLLYLILFSFAFINFNCNTTEPPPGEKPTLTLRLEDASCTEAWITLTTTNLQLPATLTLKQNNQARSTINLSTADTLLYIDSLLPNISYKYQVSSIVNPATSNKLTVTTLDATSHDFTFTTYTFGGQAGSCSLYDVAIIDENNIWAVGEIYMLDSLGQPDPLIYNAIHWDGVGWKLKRIQTYYRENLVTVRLEGIFAFTATDIWVVGSLPIYGDGTDWKVYDVRAIAGSNLSFSNAWGTSTNDMYFVGRNGSVAHYQNGLWSKIESGTDLNIGDIWGIYDGNGGYNKYLAAGNVMLIINEENSVNKINVESGHSLSSVWGVSDKLIYTAGGFGLSLYKNYKWEKINRPDVNTVYNVRGQGYNDVSGLSSTFSLLHFNGFSWQFINTGISNNIYYSQDMKNELIVAVGWQGDKAVITILRRIN